MENKYIKVKSEQFGNLGEFISFCLESKVNTDSPLTLVFEELKISGVLYLPVEN